MAITMYTTSAMPAGEEGEHRPHDPDQGRIGIPHLGQAAGHAGQHPVVRRSIQSIVHLSILHPGPA